MKDGVDTAALIEGLGRKARRAAEALAIASADQKREALIHAANAIDARQAEFLAANRKDIEYGRAKDLSAPMLDRLTLTPDRIRAMAEGLRAVAAQRDPVGEVMAEWTVPSGLTIRRVRTPLGVIGVIYESRPNVTADAGALCIKSGNATILRGGSESLNSSSAIHQCLAEGLRRADLPEDCVQMVPTRDRDAVSAMLRASEWIDVIVPRGGRTLVDLVQREARVPVFAHLEGICHVYIDADADVEMARRVTLNAKTRRTGICGAAECLLIDRAFFAARGAPMVRDLVAAGVEVRAEGDLLTIDGTVPAGPEDFGREFLDMVIAARLVEGVDGAIAHIRRYGSQHTDAIITANDRTAERFFTRLDSAILMRNASTQFADGAEFGLGAEIGIATGKLHARGPVGVEQLTSFKYLVTGNGTIRA